MILNPKKHKSSIKWSDISINIDTLIKEIRKWILSFDYELKVSYTKDLVSIDLCKDGVSLFEAYVYNVLNPNTPYHAIERIHMIKLANPGIKAYALDDADCWDTWFDDLLKIIKLVVTPNLEEVVFYLHEKEEDLQSFIFKGKEFTNTSYCDVYRHEQLNIRQVDISSIPIRAKSIRADLETNKKYLHPKVYEYIKSKE